MKMHVTKRSSLLGSNVSCHPAGYPRDRVHRPRYYLLNHNIMSYNPSSFANCLKDLSLSLGAAPWSLLQLQFLRQRSIALSLAGMREESLGSRGPTLVLEPEDGVCHEGVEK